MNKKQIINIIYSYLNDKESAQQDRFLPIPSSNADITPEDIVSVVDAALNGWFTEYRQAQRFKEELQRVTGKKYIQLCNSGSSANLLALSAVASKSPKRLIITTALSFPTTVAPIYQNNKIPIYLDILAKTLEPNYDQFIYMLQKYGEDIAGIIFTHTLGFPYDEKFIREKIAADYPDLFFISDCCDALGASLQGDIPVSSYSDISTYSFFPAHQITTGEGGAVAMDNFELFRHIQSMANWGRDCYCLPGQSGVCGKRFGHKFNRLPAGFDHKYTFTNLGYNLKMTDIQAALGISQISRLPSFVAKRRENFLYLLNGISKHSEYIHSISTNIANASPFGFPIIRNREAPFSLTDLVMFLEDKKIHTRRMFGANLTRQPAFENLQYIYLDLTESDNLLENAIWIGCHPSLNQKQLDYILATIDEFMGERA